LVEGVDLLGFGEALEVAGAVGVSDIDHTATGDGFDAPEGIVGVIQFGRGVTVGYFRKLYIKITEGLRLAS
jgi:hypothetical protein